MELLSYPKSDYLLDATRESLHKESIAWLKELDFWSEELAFFINLLGKADFSKPFPTAEVTEMQRALVVLRADRLYKVKDAVAGHERLLSALFKAGSLSDDNAYRESHRKLLHDMRDLFEELRGYKRKLFAFVEERSGAIKHQMT